MNVTRVNPQGRRPATDHAAIESAAFSLFDQRGFDETTMDDIADAVGVSRRTLFRYFPSKNDIPWGQFDESLHQFGDQLDAASPDTPIWEAVHRGVIAFNNFDETSIPQHRLRMKLILGTPTLQAHSALRYAAWRQVITDYVANRTGGNPDDVLPRLAGHISLALAISAYEVWLGQETLTLTDILAQSMTHLRDYLLEN